MMSILQPLDKPQDGSIWASHWTMSVDDRKHHWATMRETLDRAGLGQLAEGCANITRTDGFSTSSLRWIQSKKRRESSQLKVRDSREPMANVLHWYTQHAEEEDIRRHMEWLIHKLGFKVVDEPLDYEFPNQSVPHGHTHSYLLADGCYDGLARHIILAESHLAVGPHFSVHTFPEEEGGVTFFTLVTWDPYRFFRMQSKLSRWGLISTGISFGGQFSLSPNEDFYTLACCSESKFLRFMEILTSVRESGVRVLFPGCRAEGSICSQPLPLADGLLQPLPPQEDQK